MKIKRLEIKGFESHVDTTINFSGHLTVITGATDSGKSAILRAIRKLFLGEPLGDNFVNKKVGQASIVATLEDGHELSYTRKGTQSTYTIYHPSGVLQEYISSKVPEEFITLSGITKDTFGDFVQSLNFAFQLEAPFLLSETSSTGAKVLGTLANVDDVDGALKDCTAEVYKHREQRRQSQARIDEINADLQQFANLEQVESLVTACEYLVNHIEKLENRQAILNNLQSKLQTGQVLIDQLQDKLCKLSVVPELAEDLQHIEQSQQRYDRLLQLFSQVGKYQMTIDNLQSKLAYLQNVDVLTASLDSVEKSYNRFIVLQSLDKQYKASLDQQGRLTAKLDKFKVTSDLAKMLADIETKYHTLQRYEQLWGEHRSKYKAHVDACTNHGRAVTDYEQASKQYQDLWASVTCCPLDGEKLCPISPIINKEGGK